MMKYIDKNKLPHLFPTHNHSSEFWEFLGRTIATFGFLEFILKRAIFAFSSRKEVLETDAKQELEKWYGMLEKVLPGQLYIIVERYEKIVKETPGANIENFDDLINDIKYSVDIRNILCHGSWDNPDENGATEPFFINRRLERCATHIDIAFLSQTQAAVADMACAVINSVTSMGWEFPGTETPKC